MVFPPNRRRRKKNKKVSATHTCSPLIRRTAVNNTLRQSCQELSDEGQGSPGQRLCCLPGGWPPGQQPSPSSGWVRPHGSGVLGGTVGCEAGGKAKHPHPNSSAPSPPSYRHFSQKSWLCPLLVETLGWFWLLKNVLRGGTFYSYSHKGSLFLCIKGKWKEEGRQGEVRAALCFDSPIQHHHKSMSKLPFPINGLQIYTSLQQRPLLPPWCSPATTGTGCWALAFLHLLPSHLLAATSRAGNRLVLVLTVSLFLTTFLNYTMLPSSTPCASLDSVLDVTKVAHCCVHTGLTWDESEVLNYFFLFERM